MPTLVIYALVALAVMGAIGTGVYKVKQWGGHEVRAELQPKVEACERELKKQNEAVDALAAEGAKKQAAASKAIAKAEAKAKVWDDQAKRLTALLTDRKEGGDKSCKGAWQEIRK